MAELVYVLCMLTSAGCAWLLLRTYAANRVRLLLWSALCFVGFTLNNLLLVVDLAIIEEVDLSVARAGSALASVSLLLFGLIWETR
jgi:hypothetical protein